MRQLLQFLTVTLTLAVVLFAGTASASPSSSACNQGTQTAHASIPEGVPGHDHVPECE